MFLSFLSVVVNMDGISVCGLCDPFAGFAATTATTATVALTISVTTQHKLYQHQSIDNNSRCICQKDRFSITSKNTVQSFQLRH